MFDKKIRVYQEKLNLLLKNFKEYSNSELKIFRNILIDDFIDLLSLNKKIKNLEYIDKLKNL